MLIEINKRKWFIFLILASLLIIWIDFYASCLCGRCLLWRKYDLSFLKYHLAMYPIILLTFWLFPLILFMRYYKLWLFGFIFVWTMNDLLWFIVDPYFWIEFWQFEGELIAKFYLINDIHIPVYDYLMALFIFIRLFALVILWKDIKHYLKY